MFVGRFQRVSSASAVLGAGFGLLSGADAGSEIDAVAYTYLG
jgi:hypothetical protein